MQLQGGVTMETRRPRVSQPRQQVKVDVEEDEDLPELIKGEKAPVKTVKTDRSNNPLAQIELNDNEEPIALVKQQYPPQTLHDESTPPPEIRGSPKGSPKGIRGSPRGSPKGMRRPRRGGRGERGGRGRGERGGRGRGGESPKLEERNV